jgi:hypothetical protein
MMRKKEFYDMMTAVLNSNNFNFDHEKELISVNVPFTDTMVKHLNEVILGLFGNPKIAKHKFGDDPLHAGYKFNSHFIEVDEKTIKVNKYGRLYVSTRDLEYDVKEAVMKDERFLERFIKEVLIQDEKFLNMFIHKVMFSNKIFLKMMMDKAAEQIPEIVDEKIAEFKQTIEDMKKALQFNCNHTYESIIIKKATCAEVGSFKETCTICKKEVVHEEPLDNNNHTWGQWRLLEPGGFIWIRECTICPGPIPSQQLYFGQP